MRASNEMTGVNTPARKATLRQALWHFARKLEDVPQPFTVAWTLFITLGLAGIDVATALRFLFRSFIWRR